MDGLSLSRAEQDLIADIEYARQYASSTRADSGAWQHFIEVNETRLNLMAETRRNMQRNMQMSKRIFVGAGHGGLDPGAVSGIHSEAFLALRLRDRIAALLVTRGFAVKTDGAIGVNERLADSIAIAKTCDGPRVELHFNAASPAAQGVEALSLQSEKRLAQDLAKAVAEATSSPLRGEGGWKPDNSGQHHRLAFCREARGVVLELAFITNPGEMRRYFEREQAIAERLAGVLAVWSGTD